MENLKKLIDVKSLVTLALTVVFSVIAIKNNLVQEFLSIYTVVIAFYFGTQYQKRQNDVTELQRQIDETTQTNEEMKKGE